MKNRLFACGALALATFSAAAPASAQSFSQWRVSSSGGGCSVVTTKDMQPQIPSAGFGVNSEANNQFSLLVRGNMNVTTPPKSAEVQFAGRSVKAPKIGFGKLGEPNLYGIAIYLDVEYLKDMAESPSFKIRLDGEDFATYSLAERGQVVAYIARCLREKRG
ncbi:hypothetical protein L6Q21_04115 [Sandaracinobacter sp. RS1-74]|uniref:hypothetical protein n=1 Tax=Sandaracinobacteroides sayramensis TaxID=2913411 RepID=UPI001EDAFC8F|nr:hypothetical protein [Sandaracinobacteroides sayramensis]MCG2840169.1 hypothetical protein [Sandaracinobacteroides sayramensis]